MSAIATRSYTSATVDAVARKMCAGFTVSREGDQLRGELDGDSFAIFCGSASEAASLLSDARAAAKTRTARDS